MILVRQRGTRQRRGPRRDDTIFATRGVVSFRRSGDRRFISVGDAPTRATRRSSGTSP